MAGRKTATDFGWKVIRRLAEKELTRKEFCSINNVSQSRLSEIITGNTTRNTTAIRLKVSCLLEIDDCDRT
ncbi:XRE family transcriptional regulator [Cohnella endophytica]|uniref:XRE family transcriptional regulator n=1 Tax=Cohnella endophytica TaxID=2419778 RepID=A0A494XA09_9BACL|nr:XRE family transcriptional regulator [Cohnella endophytica]RKP47358.1 XRE family transcriptional regulator [Cohnella endophytica]